MKAYKITFSEGHVRAYLFTPIDGFLYINERVCYSTSGIAEILTEISCPTDVFADNPEYVSISACEFQTIKLKALKQIKRYASFLPSPVFSI
jgi:hypothetical protein